MNELHYHMQNPFIVYSLCTKINLILSHCTSFSNNRIK